MWNMKYSTWHERGTKKNLSRRQESNPWPCSPWVLVAQWIKRPPEVSDEKSRMRELSSVNKPRRTGNGFCWWGQGNYPKVRRQQNCETICQNTVQIVKCSRAVIRMITELVPPFSVFFSVKEKGLLCLSLWAAALTTSKQKTISWEILSRIPHCILQCTRLGRPWQKTTSSQR